MIETEEGLSRLEAWLGGHTALGPCTVSGREQPKNGFSAETLMLTVITADGGERGVVVRIDHPGRESFINATIARQARTMLGLASHGVPAPAVLGWTERLDIIGAPFLVMERSPGVALPQQPSYYVGGLLPGLDPAARRRAWRGALSTMAQINRIDWREDFQFLIEPSYGEPGLDHFCGWLRAWRRFAFRGDHPVIDPALDWIDANRPPIASAELIWGDANPGNFLFHADGSIAAALDFEAGAIGPAEIDLAIWFVVVRLLTAGDSPLEGIPGKAEQIAIFEEALGRRIGHLPYFEVMATLRMAIIIANLTQRLISLGSLPAGNLAGVYNPVASMLADMVGVRHPNVMDHFMELGAAMSRR